VNVKFVSDILEKRGFLGVEVVGESGNVALFIILQHADMQPHLQKKFLPVLDSAVAKGKARGQFLALLKDRISIRETGKQLYGTQVNFDQSTGLAAPKPLIDSLNIDILRASVGLPPLRYYLSLFTKTE
jgi:hypothetical protein